MARCGTVSTGLPFRECTGLLRRYASADRQHSVNGSRRTDGISRPTSAVSRPGSESFRSSLCVMEGYKRPCHPSSKLIVFDSGGAGPFFRAVQYKAPVSSICKGSAVCPRGQSTSQKPH